jgi:hypothetical protein
MTPAERANFIYEITQAVNNKVPQLSDDEHRWVKLAIQREAQSIKYRQAVIEKTLAGLVWFLLLGLAYIFKEWAINHGYQP